MKKLAFSMLLAVSFSFAFENKVLEKNFEPISLEVLSAADKQGSFINQLGGFGPHYTIASLGSSPNDRDKKTADRIQTLLYLWQSVANSIVMYDKFVHGMPDAAENLTEAKGILRNAAFKYSRAKAKSREIVGDEWKQADPKLQAIYANLLAIDLDEKVLAYYEKYLKNEKGVAGK